jgi:hypothetical protein
VGLTWHEEWTRAWSDTPIRRSVLAKDPPSFLFGIQAHERLGETGEVVEDNGSHSVSRRTVLVAGAALMAGLGSAACTSKNSSGSATGTDAGADVKSIATDAYLYGYPLVMLDATRLASSPTNQLLRVNSPPDARSRTIVAPQNDTLFAFGWLDLRPEPMVIQAPAVDGNRYWLIQMLDAWTNTIHNPSSVRPQIPAGRTSPPFTYALTGPGWSGTLPSDLTQLAMPTGTVFVAYRLQLNGSADLDNVRRLQAQVKLMPLSTWIANPNTPTPSARPPGQSVPPLQQVNAMDGPTFFNRMTAQMAANPGPPADADALKRFASIGITAGATVDNLDPGVLNAAVQDGQHRIATYTNPQARIENGWSIAPNIGAYGTDYPLRANTARVLFGANLPEDATYALRDNIDAGRYRIRFDPGQLPPVDAFWSITAYDADHFLIPNPENLYAVGHQVPVVPGPDGAVEIALQNAKPGPEVPTGNWLPIPASGKFSLAMRLYAPRDAVREGTWQPPALTPAT